MKQILIAYLTTIVLLISGGTADTTALKEQMSAMLPEVPIPVIDQFLAESDSDLSAAAIARSEIAQEEAAAEDFDFDDLDIDDDLSILDDDF